MEATVLSGPLGLTQTFPLGFQTLDPDSGAVLRPSQSAQTGLDFRNGDQQDQTPQPDLDKRVFVDKPEDLDSLIDVSTFPCGDLQLKGDLKELSCTEKINGLDEISDSTLSWLFSPNFPDVIGKNSACNEVTFTQDPCNEVTLTQDPCNEVTLTQDPCNEATLTQDPCNEVTFTQDPCNEATLTQDPCNEATLTQDPCNEATLTQDPCNEATLTQDPCNEATLTQDPCNEVTLTQDPCNEVTLTQDPCNEATLTQDPCNEATLTQDPCNEATLTQDPCNEATFTQDPCNEATITQDPCNEATFTQDPCNEATLTQYPCNEATLTQDPCNEATLTQDPCNEATLTQDPCNEVTFTQDSCNEVTLSQDPCNELTLTQDPCNELTLTQDPCNELTLTQDPCNEATLTQDPCNEVIFTQDPCNEATLTQDPCNEATLTQDPCNEVIFTQDPCNEATLTQDPCNEATLTQDPCNEATLTQDPCNEATLTQDPSPEGSVELISLSVPSSPAKTAHTDSEINAGDVFLLDLFSNEQSPGVFNPHGVSEELGEEFLEERVGLPLTVPPETRDQGLFPDQVTDPPDSTTLQSLPENCLPHDHISSSLECSEGSVPLLDLKVPDIDSCLSLCPASPASVIGTGTLLDTPREESEVLHAGATVITNPTSENQGENNWPAPGLSDEPSSLPLGEDGLRPDDPASESHSEEDVSKKLMEDISDQESKDMALDLCLTVEEVHDEAQWDLKPQEESVPDPAAEQIDEKSSVETNQPAGPAGHQVPSFEFSLHTSSSEAGWTSEQAVETISLSKMVVDDSLPMVSAASTREEDVSPLKAVFDALDQDGDGFVRIEEFMEFAAAYGADQVKDLTKFLDPSGLGVISFEDFHRGISAISNGGPEPQLYNGGYSPGDGAVSCPEEYDEQNEVTDSAYLGSESTYSECETFTDEDTGALVPPEMHEDVETDSGIEATLHDPDDGGNRFSLNSEHHNHSLVTVLGGEEEQFEDFGESNTSELLLESSAEVAEGAGDASVTKPPEEVDGSSLLSPSAAASLPDCFQSFLREEALDFFCSQCHKQISRLEDLSTRLNFLEMTSAGKRLSSKKVARHLLQNSSMTLDTMSDLTRDILELADNDITDKVLLLERRVAELEKESEASGEQHARLRQENLQLVHRANALEEQLKEQELLADEQVQQETRRHKEALNKLERERGLELENLQARLQQLDEENSELRSCVPCLRANIERLEEEKLKLQDEMDSMSDRLEDETESRRKMADKLNHERHQSQKDKECTQELIEDLRKQLEHLQLYKLEAEAKRGRTPGAGLQEYQTRTREAELEQEIKRLKQDNRTLKEQNDELNGQIINLSIQGAKNLMSASFSDSLAAEINSVSRVELMEAVHKQEEINYRLQDYIDKIIVAIMECNPSILEVK